MKVTKQILQISQAFRIHCARKFTSTHCQETKGPERIDFVGRDFVNPEQLNTLEFRNLLWTAKDMKLVAKPLDILKGRHITLIFIKQSVRYQVAFERAAVSLGANYTSFIDSDWPNQPDITDSGRLLSKITDMVVVFGMKQTDICKLSDGASVPVISGCSDLYCLAKTITDLFTLLEVVGPLRGKSLGWVGPPSSLCNTYLFLAPKLGLNIRVACQCPKGNGEMSPINLERGKQLCNGKADVHECSDIKEALHRVDFVVTSQHNVPGFRIDLKALKEASFDWYFLHPLPRTPVEVADDVFLSKQNLSWQSAGNSTFTAMALLLRFLKEYTPTSPQIDFDGPP